MNEAEKAILEFATQQVMMTASMVLPKAPGQFLLGAAVSLMWQSGCDAHEITKAYKECLVAVRDAEEQLLKMNQSEPEVSAAGGASEGSHE